MAVDLSVFDKLKTKADYDRAAQEFELRKQLLSVKAENAGGATIAAAKQLMAADPTLDFPSAFSIAKSGLGQGNTYSNGQVQNIGGAPEAFGNIEAAKQGMGQQAEKNVDLVMNPKIVRAEADQKNESELGYGPQIKNAELIAQGNAERANAAREQFNSNEQTIPVIDKLTELNNQSPTMAYSDAMQPFRKMYPGTSPEEAAVDLMKQQRLELAAPLAKQLGVNPTDKDFQASLDRIFDLSSTKESRAAQIEALSQRIKSKQTSLAKVAGQAAPAATIKIINPKTGEMYEIPEEDFPAARAEGFMKR